MADAAVAEGDLVWVEAEKGYGLALLGTKLVCRNKAGKLLASVPSAVRKGETAKQLQDVKAWLADHQRTCTATVERWMLRSLPVPREAIQAVWDDPAWRGALEYAVVAPATLEGAVSFGQAGFLLGVDAAKGVGVVNLDGETEWLDTALVGLPHPILLPELGDMRELLTELKAEQGIPQLFRETFTQPADLDPKATTIDEYAAGKFGMMAHAVGRCRSLGYRVRGGYAVCSVFEAQAVVEARYWIGMGDAYDEVWTGELLWVDEEETPLKLSQLGPVAYSEGVLMASSVYAGRVQDEDEED